MLILFLIVFIIGSLSGGALLKDWLTPGMQLADHSAPFTGCIAGWVTP